MGDVHDLHQVSAQLPACPVDLWGNPADPGDRNVYGRHSDAVPSTSTMSFRTDRNNNPAAFTVDIAKQAGLVEGTDYVAGDPFPPPSKLVTAKLLGDPIQLTIRVIDAIGYYTKAGAPRWEYIAIPKFVWDALEPPVKKKVIGFHYQHEGGTEMKGLFA